MLQKRKQNPIVGVISKFFAMFGALAYFAGIVAIIYLPSIWFGYDIYTLFGKHIPVVLAWIGGLFTSLVSLPLAIIFAVLRACGLHVPIFPHAFH